MIPRWSANGDLPPGVHFATWRELEERLSFNPRRHRMLAGFRQACKELQRAGCRLVYLDGSFVTRKDHPGDFDACWDIRNVDDARLETLCRIAGVVDNGTFESAGFRFSADTWKPGRSGCCFLHIHPGA